MDIQKNTLTERADKVLSLHSVVRLSDVIRKNSYSYVLYRRGKRSCVYEQKLTELRSVYEVFVIQISRNRILPDGSIGIAKEIFPHNEAFGKTAWSCTALERALIRFNELEGITDEQ
jgi:hypothetical protein